MSTQNPQEKSFPWGVILVIILIVAMIVIVGIFTNGFGFLGGKNASNKALSHADSTTLVLQQRIGNLESQTSDLANRNLELNTRNGKLSNAVNNLSKKLKDMTATPVVTTGNTDLKSAPIKTEQTTVSDASTTSVSGVFDAKYYDNGVFKGCIRLGGKENRYWISLAVMNGQSFNEVEDNRMGGYNFLIKGTSNLGDNAWGVTSDGTFYIKADLIDDYLIPADAGMVDVKASFTSWQPKLLSRVKTGSGSILYTYKFI